MAILATISFFACKNSTNSTADNHVSSGNEEIEVTKLTGPENDADKAAVKGIIDAYIQIKTALTKDNVTDAATAGKSLEEAVKGFNSTTLPEDKLKIWNDLSGDIAENAQHISMNGVKLEHQREHFIALSQDMEDFVKAFGTGGKVLYKDHCPMANDNQGADWISEVKDIQNPYFGSDMHTCGEVKAQFEE